MSTSDTYEVYAIQYAYRDVHRAGGSVDGVPRPGQVFPHQRRGLRSIAAFLALSQTWIEVEGGA